MLERAFDNFIVPLEIFRKDQVPEVWNFRLGSLETSCHVLSFADWGGEREEEKV